MVRIKLKKVFIRKLGDYTYTASNSSLESENMATQFPSVEALSKHTGEQDVGLHVGWCDYIDGAKVPAKLNNTGLAVELSVKGAFRGKLIILFEYMSLIIDNKLETITDLVLNPELFPRHQNGVGMSRLLVEIEENVEP